MSAVARSCRSGWLVALAAAALLAGCASVVDKPVRPVLYDFGPPRAAGASPAPAPAPLAPVILADIEASGLLDGTAVLYRLGYADTHQLRAYAQARWTAPPPQLVRQRLRDQLGRERMVLNPNDGAALAREGNLLPRVLRIELEEFAQEFETPARSSAALRLRATLLAATPAGERLLAQRSVAVRRGAPSADAPGGVRALSEATDAAAAEIADWLRQVP